MTSPISDADCALLTGLIRAVPDFPQPGVMFRDITPLLADPTAFGRAVELMVDGYGGIDRVVAIESRGFILGAPVALAMHAGLVPVRKVGRLPANTIHEDYSLEYGVNTLEIHADSIAAGDRVLIVDDVLATGGTVLGRLEPGQSVGRNGDRGEPAHRTRVSQREGEADRSGRAERARLLDRCGKENMGAVDKGRLDVDRFVGARGQGNGCIREHGERFDPVHDKTGRIEFAAEEDIPDDVK